MKRFLWIVLCLVLAGTVFSCASPCEHVYEERIVSEAGCEKKGLVEYTCSRCAYSYSEETEALGHDVKISSAVEASCTADGLTAGSSCARCGLVLAEPTVVKAKGHVEEILPALEATCTADGLTQGAQCKVCKEILTQQVKVESHGHKKVVLVSAVAPTCTEEGLAEESKCGVCGEVLSQRAPVAAKGHREKTLAAVKPTCDTKGLTEGKGCADCGRILEEQKSVPATGHCYEGIVCTLCKEQARYTSLEVERPYLDMRKMRVTGCYEPKIRYLFIPATLSGKSQNPWLSEIGSSAFEGMKTLEYAYIEDILYLGNRAFRDCSSLQKVSLPQRLNVIFKKAFENCDSLTWIVIPESVTDMYSDVFNGCDNLKAIFCEAEAPKKWSEAWLGDCKAKVYWKGEWSIVNGVPTAKK